MTAVLLGAVAYDPKVVTIWDGFRTWLRAHHLDFDYVLYSNYERQAEDLCTGRIDAAWNSPLAWVRARRMGAATDLGLQAFAMRDTDRNLRSVVVVRSDSEVAAPGDLAGRRLATGAVDSPQATLLPLSHLTGAGLDLGQVDVHHFDVGVGLHGDHIGGERDAARALVADQVDGACMTDSNLLLFGREGILAPDSVRVLTQTGPFDHCNMTAGPGADADAIEQLTQLLLGMSYADDEVRPLLDLEGLHQWLPGRTEGYTALERAVDELDFYNQEGDIVARNYRP